MTNDRSEALAGEIGSAVNGGINPETFGDAVDREHNALQDRMFRQVFRPGIVALAGTTYTDARNNNAVAMCREICEAMGWEY